MQLGRILLIVDLVIVSAWDHGLPVDRKTPFMRLSSVYANTQLINVVLYGNDSGRLFLYLFPTGSGRLLTRARFSPRLTGGVTLLDGEGGYTGEAKKVILCAVRKNEYHKVKKLVRGIEPGRLYHRRRIL